MNTKSFIEDAIKGGWDMTREKHEHIESMIHNGDGEVPMIGVNYPAVFLDPSAWQAVGKTRNWTIPCPMNSQQEYMEPIGYKGVCWKCRMHTFVGKLIEGKTIEEALGEIK